MTIELLNPAAVAIKRAVANRYGYNPYNTHAWLTQPVVSRAQRSEWNANRAMSQHVRRFMLTR